MAEETPIEGPAEAPCKQCKRPIPAGAKICTHCNQYQDWRGALSVSSTVLALLVALFSVAATAVPAIVDAVRSDASDVSLMEPTLDGRILRVVATNRGSRPASLHSIHLRSALVGAAVDVRLRDASEALIAPGSQQLVFEVVPFLSQDQAYARHVAALAHVGEEQHSAKLSVLVQSSSGHLEPYDFKIDPVYVAVMMREHSEFCETQTPTFSNRCIGQAEEGVSVSNRPSR